MIFRFIFYMIIGYFIVKAYRYFKQIFAPVNGGKTEPKVYQTEKPKRKINEKDVIEAKFEEIEVKEKKSSE